MLNGIKGNETMETMREEAKLIFLEYGTVFIHTVADETKVIHSEEDIDTAFDFSENGLIEEIISVS